MIGLPDRTALADRTATGDSSLVVLDPEPIPLYTGGDAVDAPAVGCDPIHRVCLATWDVDGDVFGTRVDLDGTLLDATPITIADGTARQGSPHVSSNGTDFLVVWIEQVTGSNANNLRGALVGPDATVGTAFPIYTLESGYNSMQLSDVKTDGSSWLVAWLEGRSTGTSIQGYFTRVSNDGLVLTPPYVQVYATTGTQSHAKAAWNGKQWLIGWSEYAAHTSNDNVFGVQVMRSGQVSDTEPVVIADTSETEYLGGLDSDGSGWYAVWTHGSSYSWVYGARVSDAGELLDPEGMPITVSSGRSGLPTTMWTGTQHVVVWYDQLEAKDIHLYGARVSTDAIVLDLEGVPLTSASGYQWFHSTAWAGTEFLVIWQDYPGGNAFNVYGERVTLDDDGDGLLDTEDNCPLASNADQTDEDGDGYGDICEPTPTPESGTPTDGDDDSSAPGDDDSEPEDDDETTPGDDDSGPGDDDASAPGDDDDEPGDDDASAPGDDDSGPGDDDASAPGDDDGTSDGDGSGEDSSSPDEDGGSTVVVINSGCGCDTSTTRSVHSMVPLALLLLTLRRIQTCT